MTKVVIADMQRFHAFLATQPLCKWISEKQQMVATELPGGGGGAKVHPPPKNDNAELAAALSSMA